MFDERLDVLPALAQRGDLQRDDGELVVEILAEFARFDGVFEAGGAADDEAEVHGAAGIAAGPVFARLRLVEEGIELRLDARGELIHLREMHRAACDAVEDGGIAKKLRFERVLRHGGALQLLVGRFGATAGFVQGAGDHVLADAELAFEHDRAVVVCDSADDVENALDGIAVADELRRRDAAQDAGRGGGGTRDARRAGGAAFALERLIDGLDEVAEVEGLREVVKSTEAHGLDGGFHAAMARDHDDGGVRELVPAHADEIEAIHVPDAQIGDDEVRLV